MGTTINQRKFFDSEEAIAIKRELVTMQNDNAFNTDSSYSSKGDIHEGNEISFVDKHMNYLSEHPKLNPKHYLSNLKLMTRLKH